MGNSSSSAEDRHGHDGIHGGGGIGVGGGRLSSPTTTPATSSSPASGTVGTPGLSHRITGGGSNNNASSNSGSGNSSSSNRLGTSSLLQQLQSVSVSLPSPFKNGGSLGLTRAELDARCQPSG